MDRSANTEFIGACLEVDMLLASLSSLRADHFGVDPEVERNWGEVGSVKRGVDLLRQAVDALSWG
jgi:hypothetical protein